MRRRRRLGQHFLLDARYLEPILVAAQIRPEDQVLEAGTGLGSLTEQLCSEGAPVMSYEIDASLHEAARARLGRLRNLRLVVGDAFASTEPFTVFVSNLPFSASSRFLDWLVVRSFRRAVVTVQREFAYKLRAPPGHRYYRAVSVLAQSRFQLSEVLRIPREAFTPPPRVGASVLVMEPRRPPLTREVVSAVRRVFAYRGRKLQVALRDLLPATGALPDALLTRLDNRVERLPPDAAVTAGQLIAAR